MSIKSRLDKLYSSCGKVVFNRDDKLVFLSDTHMSDGGPADDFTKNEHSFCQTLRSYLPLGNTIVLLGDIWDLWECPDQEKILRAHPQSIGLLEQFRKAGRLIQIKGNHDWDLDYLEGLILEIGDLKFFIAHGHQGDIWNDEWRWVGQNIVRYLWVPLQWIGLHDPTEAKAKRHEKQEREIKRWADENKVYVICGHTHRVANHQYYHNSGSWVGEGGQWIEYSNGVFTQKEVI
jgi:UDP-2,3-diacylglucosamine pyrophosphatase LpxH